MEVIGAQQTAAARSHLRWWLGFAESAEFGTSLVGSAQIYIGDGLWWRDSTVAKSGRMRRGNFSGHFLLRGAAGYAAPDRGFLVMPKIFALKKTDTLHP
jgi:hypothetical protein